MRPPPTHLPLLCSSTCRSRLPRSGAGTCIAEAYPGPRADTVAVAVSDPVCFDLARISRGLSPPPDRPCSPPFAGGRPRRGLLSSGVVAKGLTCTGAQPRSSSLLLASVALQGALPWLVKA